MQEFVDERLSRARQRKLRELFDRLDTDQDGKLVSRGVGLKERKE